MLLYGYVEEIRSTNLGTTIKLKVNPIAGSKEYVKFKILTIVGLH